MSTISDDNNYIIKGPFRDRNGFGHRFDITVVEWKNGLRAVLQESDTEVSVVGKSLIFFDPMEERAHEKAHAVEHLMLFGAGREKRKRLLRFIDSQGFSESYQLDDRIEMCAELPSRKYGQIAEVLSQITNGNGVSQSALNREIRVLLAEHHESRPSLVSEALGRGYQLLWPECKASLLIRESPSGFKSLTVEDLKSFKNESLVGQNVIIGVTGKFKTEKVIEDISQRFGFIKPKSTPIKEHSLPQPRHGIKKINRKFPGELCSFALVHQLSEHEQSASAEMDFYYRQIICCILGSLWSSKILNRSRELGAYEATVDSDVLCQHTMMYLMGLAEPNNVAAILYNYVRTINGFKSKGPSDEEIKMAKEICRFEAQLDANNLSTRTSSMCRNLYNYGKIDTFEDVQKAISKISPKGVRDYARRSPQRDKALLVLYGNTKKIELSRTVHKFCS